MKEKKNVHNNEFVLICILIKILAFWYIRNQNIKPKPDAKIIKVIAKLQTPPLCSKKLVIG